MEHPNARRDSGNIASLHEAIARQVGDRDCIVWRDRRLTWNDVTDRTRRVAHGLMADGVGGGIVDGVEAWQSPHDHVALFLTNGNEYLEAMLGCWKARASSINVNYRYTADELEHVLRDSGSVAVVYHARFAPVVAEAVARCPAVRLLIVVDDESGTAPVGGSVSYEQFLADSSPDPVALDWTGDDRYVVYTGGTTGHPKGVLWRQADFLVAALGITGTTEDLVERARRPGRPRALPAPPFMHGAAHWNALSCWLSGGTVVIQSRPDRLDPIDVLDTCARHGATSLLIVGDAFARPLVDALDGFDGNLSALRVIMTGGAALSPALKRRLRSALDRVDIVDILGSSETGRHGLGRTSPTSGEPADEPGVFTPSATTVLLDEARRRRLEPGDEPIGWLAQRGAVPQGYLGDPERTAMTFPRIDGVPHAVAGDRARLLPDGRIRLLGRESTVINTGGEKVHAEEVEQALKAHPAVYDVLVVGRASERWGQEVVAVVSPTPGRDFDARDVIEAAAASLARYKLPKDVVMVDRVRRSASGKPDYGWARRVAEPVVATDREPS